MRTSMLLGLMLAAAGSLATSAFADTPVSARWPTLEEQLAGDRVPAGSALARLIAENQQLELLAAGEQRDKIGVPPWLRVLWLKKHPEWRYEPGTPSGGYPLIIREIHEWMVGHPDLAGGRTTAAEHASSQAKAAAGADLDISGARGNAESDIRVNPWDPSRIVASANNLSFGNGMGVFYSGDGGETWRQAVLTPFPDDTFLSDPAMAWTSDGTAWATAIGVQTQDFILRLRVFRSDDGGATWTQDTTISGEQDKADRQMTWVDSSASSPFKDNLYVVWHNGAQIFVNRRRGSDGTWGQPLRVSGSETGFGIGNDIRTNSAGEVFAFWPDIARRKIFVSRSTNGGTSFLAPVTIASTFDAFGISIPAQSRRFASIYVSGGAFGGGKKGLVYAVWTDLTGSTGCKTANDEPEENVDSSCKSRIWFSRSTNGGARWQKAVMINNPATKNDQFMPALVVDEASGMLALIYYDTVGGERTTVNVWYQSSSNQGKAWSAPLRLSSATSDVSDYDGFQFGDYNSLSGIAGTFFPSWTDRRTVGLTGIWTTKITDP